MDLLESHGGNELPTVAGKLPNPLSSSKVRKKPSSKVKNKPSSKGGKKPPTPHNLSQQKYHQAINDSIDELREIVPGTREVATYIAIYS